MNALSRAWVCFSFPGGGDRVHSRDRTDRHGEKADRGCAEAAVVAQGPPGVVQKVSAHTELWRSLHVARPRP